MLEVTVGLVEVGHVGVAGRVQGELRPLSDGVGSVYTVHAPGSTVKGRVHQVQHHQRVTPPNEVGDARIAVAVHGDARPKRHVAGLVGRLNVPGSLVMAKMMNLNLRENTAIFISKNDLFSANDINAVISAMTHNGLDKRGVLVCPSSLTSSYLTEHYKHCLEKTIVVDNSSRIAVNNIDIEIVKIPGIDFSGMLYEELQKNLNFCLGSDWRIVISSGDRQWLIDMVDRTGVGSENVGQDILGNMVRPGLFLVGKAIRGANATRMFFKVIDIRKNSGGIIKRQYSFALWLKI